MSPTTPGMTEVHSNAAYALGYTNVEHERLIRQATRIAPYTERLFREAGIGPGHRVLDLGSGVGDVSMLLSRIVGPSGEVVGIERDASSIARASARVAEAGFQNIRFTKTDANQIASDQPFDAAVGRFILMFLPDPASVLRSLTQLVRPGGVVAFQEPTWIPFLASTAQFPLLSKLLHAIHEPFECQRRGANVVRRVGDLSAGDRQISQRAINLDVRGVALDRLRDLPAHDGAQSSSRRAHFPIGFAQGDNILRP